MYGYFCRFRICMVVLVTARARIYNSLCIGVPFWRYLAFCDFRGLFSGGPIYARKNNILSALHWKQDNHQYESRCYCANSFVQMGWQVQR